MKLPRKTWVSLVNSSLTLVVLLALWLGVAASPALASPQIAAPTLAQDPPQVRLSGGVAGVQLLAQTESPGAPAPQPAAAEAPPMKVDTGDTAWILVSTALVLMMTIPGLALFYGGLVRSKNILSTLMHSFFCAAMVSVVWVVVGYSLAFSPGGAIIGGLDWAMLRGVMGTNHPLAPTVPHMLFVAYQLTFAIITPALISGAFAERMRFSAFALFSILWSLLIYAPLAHWVWGGGWIGTQIGALDFAGGTVVHIASGVSALVCAIVLGKRIGYPTEPMPPHNLPFTVMGAGLLWVGWFGFNAGSALGSNELASVALINTNTAAAAAALAWLTVEYLRGRHATLLGAASGAVAGLVVITPAAGFVSPSSALIMGLLGGVACYYAVSLKPKFGYDDALDVVGVHMVGGILGAVLTGVFATKAINPAIEALALGTPTGLIDGNPGLIWRQVVAVLATLAYCGVGTFILLKLVALVTPLRAEKGEEILGMDLSQHRERGYNLLSETLGGSAEPRAAMTPPAIGERFAVVLEGIDPVAMMNRWRELCSHDRGSHIAEFKQIYPVVTTVRGTRFRFRAGDRDQIRTSLLRLFADLGPAVSARVE
jgi:ammonium transporter, Amt family